MQSHDDFLRDLEENENGTFLIEQRDGRAYLRVHPPGKKGRPVRLADVRARLELFRLEGYDPAEIEDIVSAAEGEPFAICPWPEIPGVDARVRVDVDADEMAAFIDITPASHGGRPVDREMIVAALAAAGVVSGVADDVIDQLDAGTYVDPDAPPPRRDPRAPGDDVRFYPAESSRERRLRVPIASGRAPTSGRAGRIRLYFDARPRPIPGMAGDSPERVDFRRLNVIQTCASGQLLAESLPPTVGHAGLTVRGRELPAPPTRGAQLQAGKNARLSADGAQVHAELAGHARVEELWDEEATRVSVEEILHLEAVDYSTGHIEFPGTVQIEGTVLDGFRVQAAGDIIIQKTVGNVRLEAQGDIILAGGAFCKNEGEIVAHQSIYARFVQDARIYAGRDVFIEEAAMTSHIAAGGEVILSGGRGELIGGTLLAGRAVRARKIGARSEAPTHITAGIQPEAMQRLQAIDRELQETQTTLRKIELHLAQIDEAVGRGRELPSGELETAEKLRRALLRYAGARTNLESQRRLLYASMEPDPRATVEASEALYPGVEVFFGAGVQRFRVEGRPITMYSRFVLQDGQIQLKHSAI